MLKVLAVWSLLASWAGLATCLHAPREDRLSPEATPLDDYVAWDDGAYRWEATGEVLRGVASCCCWGRRCFWEGFVLNLTSQRWLDDSVVNPSLWTHHLVVVVPGGLAQPVRATTAFLVIGGGSNHHPPPKGSNEFLRLAASVAASAGGIAAVLFQVPNQPTTFADDPQHLARYEDDIIAYTWRTFVDQVGEGPEPGRGTGSGRDGGGRRHHSSVWPLRLPMTKAAVRAMDAVQEFANRTLRTEVDSFVVAGASKRGWTAWTTAAVDKRVVGVVPLVMDALNVVPNFHHYWRSLGGWPFVFKPYWRLNLTSELDDAKYGRLMDIVDPFSYRRRLTMPKLIVVAMNDEFFMPDNSRFYLEALPGENRLLVLPNADHTLATKVHLMTRSIAAFHASLSDDHTLSLKTHALSPPIRGSLGLSPTNKPTRPQGLHRLLGQLAGPSTGTSLSSTSSVLPDSGRRLWTTGSSLWKAGTSLWRVLGGILGAPMGCHSQRPRVWWEAVRGGRGEESSLRIFYEGAACLNRVTLWNGHTPGHSPRRDFRWLVLNRGGCDLRWGEVCVQPIIFKRKTLKPANGTLAVLQTPKEGFMAFTVEMEFFMGFGHRNLVFTTEAVVVPDVYPFPDCHAEECQGALL